MITNKSFAELLLYYRSKTGLSQEKLAEKSGVSKVQIAKYETNKSNPRLKAIMMLAKALNVTEEDLGYKTERDTTTFTVPLNNIKPWWNQVTGDNLNNILKEKKININKSDISDLRISLKPNTKEIEITLK